MPWSSLAIAQAACDLSISFDLINRRATLFIGSLNSVWAKKADHYFEYPCMSGTEATSPVSARTFFLSEKKALSDGCPVVPD